MMKKIVLIIMLSCLLFGCGEICGYIDNKFYSGIDEAEKGDANAQFAVANHYAETNAVWKPDYNKAFTWYLKAANQGHSGAQYELGNCYKYGKIGLSKNLEEAKKWYTLAVNNGHPYAKQELDEILEKETPRLSEQFANLKDWNDARCKKMYLDRVTSWWKSRIYVINYSDNKPDGVKHVLIDGVEIPREPNSDINKIPSWTNILGSIQVYVRDNPEIASIIFDDGCKCSVRLRKNN